MLSFFIQLSLFLSQENITPKSPQLPFQESELWLWIATIGGWLVAAALLARNIYGAKRDRIAARRDESEIERLNLEIKKLKDEKKERDSRLHLPTPNEIKEFVAEHEIYKMGGRADPIDVTFYSLESALHALTEFPENKVALEEAIKNIKNALQLIKYIKQYRDEFRDSN